MLLAIRFVLPVKPAMPKTYVISIRCKYCVFASNVIPLTIHHHVHSCQLRPDLGEDTDVESVDHVRLDEFKVRNVLGLGLERYEFTDFLKFFQDERCIAVTLGMDEGCDKSSQLELSISR